MKRTLAALALAAIAGAAAAQAYPGRPIRMVVPNPAGGANDIVARIVALKLGAILDQQIVVQAGDDAVGRGDLA